MSTTDLLAILRGWVPWWFTAAALAVAGALAMGWVGKRLHWLDQPTHRSSHDRPTPTAGGVGMVAAVLLYAALFWGHHGWGVLLLVAGTLLAATGWRDDWRPLPVRWRLAVQAVAVAAGMVAVGWALAERGVAPWQGWPPTTTALFALGLFAAALWWVNLFNFMDGIDGFAAQEAVFLATAGALLVLLRVPEAVADPWWGWGTVLAAAAAGFLFVNWPPARIFMGDVASTFLPWALFLWALYWVAQEGLPVAAALLLPILFVTDATVTLVVRWRQGIAVTTPHRSHLYQQLARRWGGTAEGKIGHRRASRAAFLVNLLVVAPLAWGVGQLPLAAGWAVVALLYAVGAFLVWRAGAGRTEPLTPDEPGSARW